jgi:Domain of unknown function (DUF4105)
LIAPRPPGSQGLTWLAWRAAAAFLVTLAMPGLFWGVASAQEITATDSTDQATPGSELEVYLVTAAPGDAIWERFSHNALWIRNRDTGTDIAYNWGIFSFTQESFIKRLAQGRMLYSMYGVDMGRMIRQYQKDDRELDAHPVNLTPAERLELLSIVQAMDTDENRNYLYQYYLDNCSTRVRDALDQVLGGQIQERWGSEMTGKSFRWHTRRLLQSVPWAYYGIQFVLGHPGDEEISAWDEMFLPLLLRNYLERTEVTHEDGTTTPLLGQAETLYASSRGPVPTAPRSSWFVSLLVGLVVAGMFWLLARSAAGGSKAALWGFGMLGGGWALLTALLGTGLIFSWFFTDHTFWRLNQNALLMNPVGFASAVGIMAGMWGRGWSGAVKWTRITTAIAVTGVLAQLLPGLGQEMADMALLVLPGHFALAAGVLMLSRGQDSVSGEAAAS